MSVLSRLRNIFKFDYIFIVMEIWDIVEDIEADPSLQNIEDGIQAFAEVAYPLLPKRFKATASKDEVINVIVQAIELRQAIFALKD